MACTTWLLVVGVVFASISFTWGCSCRPLHPQEHYCTSDFVILARVKREFVYNETRVYKTRIRKEFKMSEKARVALKSGRILTATEDSVCGVHLEVGKLYVISGKIVSLKARINLCNLQEPWEKLTRRQRKGLSRMYRLGCNCRIQFCYPNQRCHRTKDACNWVTWHHSGQRDCQRSQGICLRSASQRCLWAKNKAQATCMRNITTSMANTRNREPLTISLWSG